jgi:hypothetical protein
MNRPLAGKAREIPDKILEEEFRKSTPPVLYKYRTWTSEKHKEALTKSLIWFSNTKQLNDLYDIRLAYTFDPEEVHKPEFFAKLRERFSSMTRTIPGTRDFEYALENHYDLIKADPEKWFYNNQASLRQGGAYDVIGLFSTTTNPVDELMWAHYGNSHKGYCIGYDSFLLWQAKHSMFGKAHYISKPINYSFLDSDPENFIDLFIKAEKWTYEEEYRLVTFIDNDEERLVTVKKSTIKEVILGNQISPQAEDEIIKCLKNRYNSKVNLYKIEADNVPELKLSPVLY